MMYSRIWLLFTVPASLKFLGRLTDLACIVFCLPFWWGGGGENGGREFSWVVWYGGRENSVYFTANSEKIDKNLEIFTKL
jgi:hypothetical protein